MYQYPVILLLVTSTLARRVPFYRRDYKYLEDYDAFYKLHQVADDWTGAFEVCDVEGSRLFYPETEAEGSVVKILADAVPGNVSDVMIGLRDEFRLGQVLTLNGDTTPFPIFQDDDTTAVFQEDCVLLDTNGNYIRAECNQSKHFICKKVEEQRLCPTIDKGYVYKSSTGKCYKVNSHQQTWQDAQITCFNEGGSLVIIDDAAESHTVLSIIDNDKNYHMGVRRVMPVDRLFTVKGVRLADSYQLWYRQEDQMEDCGTLSSYNDRVYFKTVDCGTLLPFVCEMDTKH